MTKRPERRLVGVFHAGSVLVAALITVSGPLGAAEIVPHDARYDLVLRRQKLDGRVTKSGGKLLLRIERICEGWRIGTRLDFRASMADGGKLDIEITNGVEESLDGNVLSFATQSRLNGDVQVETKGAAGVKAGNGGRAIFTVPARHEVALPEGALFPAAGARLLLDRLIAGRTQVQRLLFDGSAPEPYEVLDTVAPGRLAPGSAPKGDGALLAAPSWRLQSLWTRNDGREKVQNLEVQLHANGVTSRMIIDLGVIALDARLAEIRRLPEPEC